MAEPEPEPERKQKTESWFAEYVHLFHHRAFWSVLTLRRELGMEMVTITAGKGPSAKVYHIHKNLLCSKSEVFNKMFNSGFLETASNSADLPDDNPLSLTIFIGWVYHDTLQISFEDTQAMKNLYMVFLFAEKYGMDKLMDEAMNLIVELQEYQPNRRFEPSAYSYIYSKTHEVSKLRLYASRMYAHSLLTYKDTSKKKNLGLNTEKLLGAGLEEIDILQDVFGMIRNQSGKIFPHPADAPRCDYHQHGKDEKCPFVDDVSSGTA